MGPYSHSAAELTGLLQGSHLEPGTLAGLWHPELTSPPGTALLADSPNETDAVRNGEKATCKYKGAALQDPGNTNSGCCFKTKYTA